MYLKNLIKAVDDVKEMPIEVEELAAHLVQAGCQDSIIFHPTDEDPGKLQGVFCQYTTHPGMYSAPEFVTLIVFSKHLDVDWQRLVCCKELIHACDSKAEQTDKPEEVKALLEKVIGPLTTKDFGLADVMAAKDKLAVYQALALLFPPHARAQALESGRSTEEIADWACLPIDLIEFALTEDWPGVREALLDGWGE